MSAIVRVWDAPTRLFHWALVVCVIGLVVTAQVGGAAMDWHFRLGYCVFALLLFRLIWGVVGGYWSRFASFLYGPTRVLKYIKGNLNPNQTVGHNPLGAISVFAMLGFLAAQVATGLFSDDEIAAAGPLVRFVSSSWVTNATYYHKEVGKVALLMLVAMHIVAIGFYFFKKGENLVKPMITGDKLLDFPVQATSDTVANRAKAVFIGAICVAIVGALVILVS